MKVSKVGRMEVEFDLDCMSEEKRRAMEHELHLLLSKFGWECWAEGADCDAPKDGVRTRDIAFEYKQGEQK